jgi:RNA polymerase sigma-70 factor (ECF subfamily)
VQQVDAGLRRGLDALRAAVLVALVPPPAAAVVGPAPSPARTAPYLLAESVITPPPDRHGGRSGPATSSEPDEAVGRRLIALVELARGGDAEAFGALYDHYQPSVYRFLYYRVGSAVLAEDLTSETFVRALRSISSFRWQGKDFGAWLTTIARNLATDHVKSGRARLEVATEDMTLHDAPTEGPENAVLAAVTHEAVLEALHALPEEQQECLVLRFLQSRSIAETAAVMGRSEGAVKQLQLRAVRNLAKRFPEGLR